MARLGAWLAGAVGLAIIAAIILLVFESVSHWPADQTVTPQAISETQFRRCPAVVMAPPRAPGMPVDDLASIRPGLSRQDAENLFNCMAGDQRFALDVQPYEALGKARQFYDMFSASRDGVIWRLGMFGPKGDQRVRIVRRDATFSPSRGPVIAEIEEALLRHFGPAHEAHDIQTGGRQLTWTYLKDSKPVRVAPVEGSPSYLIDMAAFMARGFLQNDCAKHAKLEPEAAPSFDVRCGLTIRASIEALAQDKLRAWRVRQVIVDQQGLAAAAPSAVPTVPPTP
jgi:hypothetical protein